MSDLQTLPTLDQLAADPRRAQALAETVAFELLSRCLTVQGALLARLPRLPTAKRPIRAVRAS